jgi:predicted transcriptional regulator
MKLENWSRIRNPKVVHFQKLMPIRVSDEMHDKLRHAADRREWDLSKLVRYALSQFLATER